MKRLEKAITTIMEIGTLTSTFLLIVSVCVQIVGRFLLESAPAWTEEASRIFFIYAISFAAGIALKEGYYVQLDFVYNKLSEKSKLFLDYAGIILMIILFSLISFYSVQFIILGQSETAPSLGIPMSITFASVLVMSGSISFYAIVQLFDIIKNP